MSTPAESAAHTAQWHIGAQSAERHPPIDGSGDPQAIEHSIDQTRDRLRHILEALQSKLSPAQIFDRGLHYLKDNGSELAGSLGQRIKRNPIPMVLSAAGIGLLLAVSVSGRARRHRRGMSHTQDLIADASRAARGRSREARAGLTRLIRRRPLLLSLAVIATSALLVALPGSRTQSARPPR